MNDRRSYFRVRQGHRTLALGQDQLQFRERQIQVQSRHFFLRISPHRFTPSASDKDNGLLVRETPKCARAQSSSSVAKSLHGIASERTRRDEAERSIRSVSGGLRE